MCGIVYVSSKDTSAKKRIGDIYKEQKTRGTDGFGFVTVNKGGEVKKVYRAQDEKSALKKLAQRKERTILFHHRYPTSTPNIAEAAHPIHVKSERLAHEYYVVHNGIISNADTLKAEHEKLGYKYTTDIENVTTWTCQDRIYTSESSQFNDSEALAIELAEYIEGKKDKMTAHGSIAFVLLQVKDGIAVRLYYGRNERSPLIETKKNGLHVLSSEAESTQNVEPHILHWYEYATGFKGRQDMEMDKLPTIGFHSTYPYSMGGSYGAGSYTWGGHDAWDGGDRRTASTPNFTGSIGDFTYNELRQQGYENDDILYEVEDEMSTTEELLMHETNKGMQEVYRKRMDKLNTILDAALAYDTSLSLTAYEQEEDDREPQLL